MLIFTYARTHTAEILVLYRIAKALPEWLKSSKIQSEVKCATKSIHSDLNCFVSMFNSILSGATPYVLKEVVCEKWIKKNEETVIVVNRQVTILVHCDYNLPRIVTKISVLFLKVAFCKYRKVLNRKCFLCLVYLIVEEFFISNDRLDYLGYFLESIVDPFCRKSPAKEKCYEVLKMFRNQHLLQLFLFELMHASNRKEAKETLDLFHKKVACKKRGVDVNPFIRQKCVCIMVSRKNTLVNLDSYIAYIQEAIIKERIRRIYVLALGDFNVALADTLNALLVQDLKLIKAFAERFTIIHDDHLHNGIRVAYYV